ncbi:MAG: hypothetical protein WBA48_10225, partial [Xanthobacteraceae bacterium]
PNRNEQERKSRPLDQNLRPKPYIEAGHFSAKIPGQLSAEINSEMATTAAKIGDLSVKLAESALIARERGDEVHALFFSIKAAELLSLAKALGWKPGPTRPEGQE